MSNSLDLEWNYWMNGRLPKNVELGVDSIIRGDKRCLARFQSQLTPALTIGDHCTMDGVHFALGERARVRIGNYCYFNNAILLCELELRIGNYVAIGWNTTIADSDFHPIIPAERIVDAIALSPLGGGRARPKVVKQRVIVEDDVWIGPNSTILKGVHIGKGAFIEAGALVTGNVPSRVRIAGNPARIIGEV